MECATRIHLPCGDGIPHAPTYPHNPCVNEMACALCAWRTAGLPLRQISAPPSDTGALTSSWSGSAITLSSGVLRVQPTAHTMTARGRTDLNETVKTVQVQVYMAMSVPTSGTVIEFMTWRATGTNTASRMCGIKFVDNRWVAYMATASIVFYAAATPVADTWSVACALPQGRPSRGEDSFSCVKEGNLHRAVAEVAPTIVLRFWRLGDRQTVVGSSNIRWQPLVRPQFCLGPGGLVCSRLGQEDRGLSNKHHLTRRGIGGSRNNNTCNKCTPHLLRVGRCIKFPGV